MINVKKVSVIALILLLVGVVGSILTLKSAGETVEVTEEIEISEEDFMHIDIETENAEIEILPTSDIKTTVEFTGNRANEKRYNLNADVEEDILLLTVKEKGFRFFDFDFTFSTPSLKIYLPEKMYESIQIETANGRVQVVELQTNDINVKTSNGRIELTDVMSAVVTTSTSNGSIELENVEGTLFGKTSNGSISLTTDNLDRPIEFKTSNGRIEIQTDNEPTNATFDIKRDNGKVTIFGDSNWDTVVGNGDNVIKLTTSNGSIIVTK